MVTYDSKLIYTFADRLYQQAQRIVVSYTLAWGLFGLLGGGAIGIAVADGRADSSAYVLGFLGGLVLGAIGYQQGQAKAFWLRLEAQRALCAVATEENTRKVAAPA